MLNAREDLSWDNAMVAYSNGMLSAISGNSALTSLHGLWKRSFKRYPDNELEYSDI